MLTGANRDEGRFQEAQRTFEQNAHKLEERLQDQDFLQNKSLGNEVGFHVFCYDPALELQARALFQSLQQKADSGILPCRLIERNLYDILIKICTDKRILDAIPKQEAKRGSAAQTQQLQKVATPELFARELDYGAHEKNDVLLITGVGQVYPALRAHTLLENIQPLFADIPVIIAYPGAYSGQSFALFEGIEGKGLSDGNYYRAFSLV